MNPSINPSTSLLRHFESIDEPRTEYLIEHQLLDIIAITICAVICGAESWVKIEEYGYSKQEWLQQFLALPNGIPSRDTIRRLFAQLDPKQLQRCFFSWIKTIAQLTEAEISPNGTVVHLKGYGFILVFKKIVAPDGDIDIGLPMTCT